jgi:hypothetical protein
MALTSVTFHPRKLLPTCAPCLPHPSTRPHPKWIIRPPSNTPNAVPQAPASERVPGHVVAGFGQSWSFGLKVTRKDPVASKGSSRHRLCLHGQDYGETSASIETLPPSTAWTVNSCSPPARSFRSEDPHRQRPWARGAACHPRSRLPRGYRKRFRCRRQAKHGRAYETEDRVPQRGRVASSMIR